MTDTDRIRHQFKNQLGVILGFSDLLLAEAGGDDHRRGDLEAVRQAAATALELLDTLFPVHANSTR